MRIFTDLNLEIVDSLEDFRQWAMSAPVRESLERSIARRPDPFEGRPQHATSNEYLRDINYAEHVGYPLEMKGIDINYKVLQKDETRVEPELFQEARQKDRELDDDLQLYLGAKFCALKAYYPAGGYISWHNNWNAAGYNIIFTYSGSGDGYWRHVEPATEHALSPDTEKIIHVQDPKGWHCKVGYFGARNEPDKVLWHCAATNEPRITIGYVIQDPQIWHNMVNEIAKGSKCLM